MKLVTTYQKFAFKNSNPRYRTSEGGWFMLHGFLGIQHVDANESVNLEQVYQGWLEEQDKKPLQQPYVGSDHTYMAFEDENTGDIVFSQRTGLDDSLKVATRPSEPEQQADQTTRTKAGTYTEFNGKQYRKYSGFWWVGDTMERVSNPLFILELNERYLAKVNEPTRPSEDDMMSAPEPQPTSQASEYEVLGKLVRTREGYLKVIDGIDHSFDNTDEDRDRVDQIIDLQVQVKELRKRAGMDA